jgi:hypothetical protein
LATAVLYQRNIKKSSFFRQLHDLTDLLADRTVIFPAVGLQTFGALLDAVFGVGEGTAAPVAQGIQGAEAEQAAELLRISPGVAGKILAFFMLKKIVIRHNDSSYATEAAYGIIKTGSRGSSAEVRG